MLTPSLPLPNFAPTPIGSPPSSPISPCRESTGSRSLARSFPCAPTLPSFSPPAIFGRKTNNKPLPSVFAASSSSPPPSTSWPRPSTKFSPTPNPSPSTNLDHRSHLPVPDPWRLVPCLRKRFLPLLFIEHLDDEDVFRRSYKPKVGIALPSPSRISFEFVVPASATLSIDCSHFCVAS